MLWRICAKRVRITTAPFYVYVFVFELAKIHLTETMCVEAKRVFISVYNIC